MVNLAKALVAFADEWIHKSELQSPNARNKFFFSNFPFVIILPADG